MLAGAGATAAGGAGFLKTRSGGADLAQLEAEHAQNLLDQVMKAEEEMDTFRNQAILNEQQEVGQMNIVEANKTREQAIELVRIQAGYEKELLEKRRKFNEELKKEQLAIMEGI